MTKRWALNYAGTTIVIVDNRHRTDIVEGFWAVGSAELLREDGVGVTIVTGPGIPIMITEL